MASNKQQHRNALCVLNYEWFSVNEVFCARTRRGRVLLLSPVGVCVFWFCLSPDADGWSIHGDANSRWENKRRRLSWKKFSAFSSPVISAKAPGESHFSSACVRAFWLGPKSIIYGRLCKLIFRPLLISCVRSCAHQVMPLFIILNLAIMPFVSKIQTQIHFFSDCVSMPLYKLQSTKHLSLNHGSMPIFLFNNSKLMKIKYYSFLNRWKNWLSITHKFVSDAYAILYGFKIIVIKKYKI